MTKRLPLPGHWTSAAMMLVSLATAAMMTGCGRQPEQLIEEAGTIPALPL